ncbi:MAG: hypothetical protein FWF26_06110, partial [Treponema sp.]|nr:hypothetical protein [Treponema sp.]
MSDIDNETELEELEEVDAADQVESIVEELDSIEVLDMEEETPSELPEEAAAKKDINSELNPYMNSFFP